MAVSVVIPAFEAEATLGAEEWKAVVDDDSSGGTVAVGANRRRSTW